MMTTLLVMVVALAASIVQIGSAGAAVATASTFNLTKSTLVVAPKSSLTNAKGYDYTNNAQRYQLLYNTADVKASNLAQQTWGKWAVVNGTKALVNGKSTIVTTSKQLKFYQANIVTRSNILLTFKPSSGLVLDNSGLNLTDSLIDFEFTPPTSQFYGHRAILTLTRSAISGSPRLFRAQSAHFSLSNSSIALAHSPFQLADGELTLQDSSLRLTGPAPFLISQTSVTLKRASITLINVPDAFFVQSTLAGQALTIELVNSNVRFIDTSLEFTNAFFKLTNSTVQFLSSVPTVDKYLASYLGALSGSSKLVAGKPVPYPRQLATDALFDTRVKGTGSITFSSSKN